MVESSHALEQRLDATSGYAPVWVQRAASALSYYLKMISHIGGNGEPDNPTYDVATDAIGSVANSATTTSGQGAQHTVEIMDIKLQAMLKDPKWERRLVGTERERFLIGVLEASGYRNLSGDYNPNGYIFTGHGKVIAKVNFREGKYKPLNGSIPDDMGIILKKAGINPDK